MAMRRPPASGPASSSQQQQVFKPRATVAKFSQIFPVLYGLFGLVFLLALGAGIYFKLYLVPVMVAFPIFGTVAAGVYANRLSRTRVVIDGERLRILQGNAVKTAVAWHTVTRLTIRKERDEDFYELWVKGNPIPLMAAFYEDGDKLLKAVSARTSLAWERT